MSFRIFKFFSNKLLSRKIIPTFLHFSINAINPKDFCRQKMKLDSPQFRSLFTPELDVILQLFKKYGFELRIAGGAVRDLLLGQTPHDIDFATTATPQQMIEMFDKEQIRMLRKQGEKHGTVMCRVNDKENFEITTLRIDRVCDGRHAEVEFTTDWVLDANRRDLTVNSLFLGYLVRKLYYSVFLSINLFIVVLCLDGTVYDFFNGIEDLNSRRIAFVGNGEQRIQEDYLRILRYFRFFGRLSDSTSKHEQETLVTIRNNAKGLSGISGERLWVELKQIINGRMAGPIMRTMFECELFPQLGLPPNANVNEFDRVWNLCRDFEPKAMTLLPALLNEDEQVFALDERLKVSRKERLLALFIISERSKFDVRDETEVARKYFRDLFVDQTNPGVSTEGSVENVFELLKYLGLFDILDDLKAWNAPKFPVNGVMVMSRGVNKGPAMRVVLSKLFELWKASNFTATEEELLDKISDVYKREKSKSPPRKSR